MVGDGHAVDVAAEIAQDMGQAAEGQQLAQNLF
jgi:hypothetical protein